MVTIFHPKNDAQRICIRLVWEVDYRKIVSRAKSLYLFSVFIFVDRKYSNKFKRTL